MGQKKVNKANDAFGLKKSREQNNQKSGNGFSNKNTNGPNNTAIMKTFLEQVKEKSIQNKQVIK